MTNAALTGALAGGAAGGGATDVFGVGRIVDEASEIIHEFDRPIFSMYTSLKGKRGSSNRIELHISKLDILMFTVLAAMIIAAIKHAEGSKSAAIYAGSFPMFDTLLAGRLRPADTGGGGVSGAARGVTLGQAYDLFEATVPILALKKWLLG